MIERAGEAQESDAISFAGSFPTRSESRPFLFLGVDMALTPQPFCEAPATSPFAHIQGRLTLTLRRQTHHPEEPNKGINVPPLGPDIMGSLILSLVNATVSTVTGSVLKADQMTFRGGSV